MNIATELVKIARLISTNVIPNSIIDGKSKQQARKIINDLLYPLTKSMHRDETWQGVKLIWEMLDRNGVEYVMTSTDYEKNSQGVPQSKRWKFEIEFLDNKNKLQTLYGNVSASGAAGVDDPLAVYDIVGYVS